VPRGSALDRRGIVKAATVRQRLRGLGYSPRPTLLRPLTRARAIDLVTAPDGYGTYRRQRAMGWITDFSICRRAANPRPTLLRPLTRASRRSVTTPFRHRPARCLLVAAGSALDRAGWLRHLPAGELCKVATARIFIACLDTIFACRITDRSMIDGIAPVDVEIEERRCSP
jgi:hypothetical protein